MSLHYADGKLANQCGRITILDDPERVRKELGNEQRKQRIKEVRDQSNQLARKIRQDVAAERERELQGLQAIKAQEFNCWRDHILAQKTQDYRQAIFQVGAAHRAAQLEKKALANRAGNYQDFRKQIKARRSCANQENQQNTANACKTSRLIRNASPGHNKMNACSREKMKAVKRKRRVCCKEKSCCCCCYSSESEEDQEEACDEEQLISSTSSSTLDSSSDPPRPTKHAINLRRTPAVLVDVEVDSNDSVTVTTPYEVRDKHVETNRQFNAVVRVSPAKTTAHGPHKSPVERVAAPPANVRKETTVTTKPRYTQITDLLGSKKDTSPQRPRVSRPMTASQPKPPPPTSKSVTPNTTPRFLLGSKKDTSPQRPRVSRPMTASQPKPPPPTPKSVTPSTSPKKTSAPKTIKPTRKQTVDAACGPLTPSKCNASTSCSVETKSIGCGARNPNSNQFVRFYDYNSKYTKSCAPIGRAVREEQNCQSGPNANQQAILENNLRESRERQREELREKTEERGQKAMEREQVRRDCLELTEKLDELTRQHPRVLPNDTNLRPAYRHANAAARKQTKLNSAIEDIMLQPAIITCPEQGKQTTRNNGLSSRNNCDDNANRINLGAVPARNAERANNTTSTSDSCGSILLGYVSDQSNKIRNDIDKCAQSSAGIISEKSQKLQNLLERIESLRDVLLKELKCDSPKSASVDAAEVPRNVQNVIDSISDMRKERENILLSGINSKKDEAAQSQKALQAKEAILEQKVREFFAMQNADKHKSTSKRTVNDCTNKPIEIIISVQNKGKCQAKVKKAKPSKPPKNQRKPPAMIQGSSLIKTKKATEKVDEISKSLPPKRLNSYDSASTSYLSLPSVIANNMDQLLNNQADNRETTSAEQQHANRAQNSRTRLNPLIAHYIQRLLGMTRTSIQTLGVSSSDVQTPSSSIVDNMTNRTVCSVYEGEEQDLSQERLVTVEKFINENRSFVNDLEQSLTERKNQNLEESMRIFEEIWQQRLMMDKQKLCKDSAPRKAKSSSKKKSEEQTTHAASQKTKVESTAAQKSRPIAKSATPRHQAKKMEKKTSLPLNKQVNKPVQQDSATAHHSINNAERVSSERSRTDAESSGRDTVNYTQRIAELTQLIERVREEKQRLLEVTLSSISDNGRGSTEYLDLPNEKKAAGKRGTSSPQRKATPLKLLDSAVISELLQSSPECTEAQLDSMENAPLEKNKQTAHSRDSGISMSRPITALEQHPEIPPADPNSIGSTHTASSTSSQQRKGRPPPTIRRFSPQLIEDEVAHELSTILEVDTPATTRVTNAADMTEGKAATPCVPPTMFPTFEEYARELHLDITRIDPEQSMNVQHELNELIATLKATPDNEALNYVEFPSLSAYLKSLAAGAGIEEAIECALPNSNNTASSIDELLACLRLANLTVKSFPTRNEYMPQRGANAAEAEAACIDDSESLAAVTETDSESMLNIEEELKRRKILRHSFHRDLPGQAGTAYTHCRVVNSTVCNSSVETSRIYAQMMATESGIEKFSTSPDSLSGELERELRKLGIDWPTTMRRKSHDAQTMACSNSTSPDFDDYRPSTHARVCKTDPPQCSDPVELERPSNFRDFLTRELMKRTNTSDSSSSDTLKNHFLNSIIDSLTPRSISPTHPRAHINAASNSANATNRQKTSTPVNSQSLSSPTPNACTSSTNTQLFSGESRLSSVHGAEDAKACAAECQY